MISWSASRALDAVIKVEMAGMSAVVIRPKLSLKISLSRLTRSSLSFIDTMSGRPFERQSISAVASAQRTAMCVHRVEADSARSLQERHTCVTCTRPYGAECTCQLMLSSRISQRRATSIGPGLGAWCASLSSPVSNASPYSSRSFSDIKPIARCNM